MLSVDNTLLCMFWRVCTYFQNTGVHIVGGGGGGMYFWGIAADSSFQKNKNEGVHVFRGVLTHKLHFLYFRILDVRVWFASFASLRIVHKLQ